MTPEGRPRLEVADLRVPGVAEPFDLTVRAGEIVGLAGLVGSGRTELTRALFGDLPAAGGTVRVDGRPVRLRSPREAMRGGVFMLSEDRKGEGILPHLDVTENAMVSRDRSALPLLQRLLPVPADERARFARLRDDMRIRVPHGRQLIGNLSGGNQQKVLLGRALLSGCSVLLLNEPTRGMDVGAKDEVMTIVQRLREKGVAILLITTEPETILSVADRALVMSKGGMSAELSGGELTKEQLMKHA